MDTVTTEHAGTPATDAATRSLIDLVRDEVGSNVYRCYQCVKCTSGCPLADQFDLTPNQVMRGVQFENTRVLESKAIWLCASCHTCATRCPQEINVTGVMDALRIESRRRGVPPGIPEIAKFNDLFMLSIKIFGRAYEAGLMAAFNAVLRQPFRDMKLGLRMFRRGKLSLLPHFGRGRGNDAPVKPNPRAIGYYPGCSLSSSAIEYGRSVKSIAEALDLELVIPKGWVCCGSSPAHATDPVLANVLPMRTVAAVEKMGLDTVTSPCSACFSRLKTAEQAVRQNTKVEEQVRSEIGYDYKGTVEVRHLVEVIVDRAGLGDVAGRVTKPLAGLKVACYYGCLITRPPGVTGADNPEYPLKMDRLVEALGAETVDWSHKTDCCGAALGVAKPEAAAKLMRRVMGNARECGAEAMVTMCPICHLNLDSRQAEMGFEDEMPIFQATQLMALAFGLGEKKAALGNNLVDPRPYLQSKGVLPAS